MAWNYKLYSDYRKEQNKYAAEWFKIKKYAVHKKYDYILDTYENWKKNIIAPEVADFIERLKNEAESKKEPFPLHKYIHNGYFVMLIDKRNPAFQKSNGKAERGLIPFLISLLPEKYKDVVKVIYMQDVVNMLDISKYNWKDDFKLKYFGKIEYEF